MQYEFYDPASDVTIYYDRLPHWDQPGVMCFLTWRTIDSIPEATIRRWQVERAGWLRRHGIDPQAPGWREQLRSQSPLVRREYHEHFTSPWMECLDACHGECVLRQPALSVIVAENLLHADGGEYALSDFVVMPNHVHVLAQFRNEGAMKRSCRNWKHYTARRIHEELGRRGHFWQTESFDHLVRSAAQCCAVLRSLNICAGTSKEIRLPRACGPASIGITESSPARPLAGQWEKGGSFAAYPHHRRHLLPHADWREASPAYFGQREASLAYIVTQSLLQQARG